MRPRAGSSNSMKRTIAASMLASIGLIVLVTNTLIVHEATRGLAEDKMRGLAVCRGAAATGAMLSFVTPLLVAILAIASTAFAVSAVWRCEERRLRRYGALLCSIALLAYAVGFVVNVLPRPSRHPCLRSDAIETRSIDSKTLRARSSSAAVQRCARSWRDRPRPATPRTPPAATSSASAPSSPAADAAAAMRRACEAGSGWGCFSLGDLTLRGPGVDASLGDAAYWHQRVCSDRVGGSEGFVDESTASSSAWVCEPI